MKIFTTLLALAVSAYDSFCNPGMALASNDRVEEQILMANSSWAPAIVGPDDRYAQYSGRGDAQWQRPHSGNPYDVLAFANDGFKPDVCEGLRRDGVSNDFDASDYSKKDQKIDRVRLFSNDANLDGAVFVQPLYDFVSRTADDDGFMAEMETMFPSVPVGRQFAYHQANQTEDFQTDDADNSDVRQIYGDFKQIEFSGQRKLGETINKGLLCRLDHDMNGRDPSVREAATRNLMNRLIRSEMSRGFTQLATAQASTYSSGTVNWGKSNTTADPDNDLVQVQLEASDSRGIDGNLIMMSEQSWARRFSALANTVNPALTTTRTMTPEQLAAIIGVDKIHKTKRRKQVSINNATGAQTKVEIAGSTIYFYYAAKGASAFDPSNIKRFSSTADGLPIRVWMKEDFKHTTIGVEWYSTIIVTSTLGFEKLAITYT